MIFYSDDIKHNYESCEEFKNDTEMIFTYFAYSVIGLDYIKNLLEYETNKIAFYCIDNDEFNIRNCPSCMIYAKNGTDYYIMIICTLKKFRNLGYATMLLKGFIDNIKQTGQSCKIILSALDDVVSYYQHLGFEAVDYTLENYPYLLQFEKFDSDKMYTVMEYVIE